MLRKHTLLVALFILQVVSGCSDSESTQPDLDGDAENSDIVDGDWDTLDRDNEPEDGDIIERETEAERETTPSYSLSPIKQWQLDRQQAYREYTCANADWSTGSIGSLLMLLSCAERGEVSSPEPGIIPLDTWDSTFDNMYRLKDCSDFAAMRFVNLLYAFHGHPALSDELWAKIEDNLIAFKYWFSDPTPQREFDGEAVVDNMWYWSENHVLIFRTVEYLMGHRYPERVFSVTGMTGAQHKSRAKAEILTWLEERARWGFAEWHSDVYYNLDLKPLLTLVQWAPDEEVAFKAAQVLDLLLLDYALHLHKGNFGATHGRSYIKDKPSALLQDAFDAVKLVFDDTSLPYRGPGNMSAALLAISDRYAVPTVIRDIASYDEPMIDSERMNLPLDERPPENWDDPVPEAPHGRAWLDEANISFWWSLGAFTTWPLLPLTLDVAEEHNLWEGQFKSFSMIRDLVDISGDKDVMKTIYPFYKILWPVLGSGLLAEVHTYTYRDAHVMLSSAQDYRKGLQTNQAHHWQATLSEHAVVFTTHPAYLPVPEGEAIPADFSWGSADQPGPGYWTGSASRPRSAQYEKAAIHIYAPQYEPRLLAQDAFDYREETHAYFPQAHFDEVVQEGSWTFGRKADGYVALYSYLPTVWREGQPDVYENDGKPFDLVAPDSAQNVWIVEVGSVDDYGSFGDFQQAILAAAVSVSPVTDQDDDGLDDGYDVVYHSPSQGDMRFGWHTALVVEGVEIELHPAQRHQNPFVTSSFDEGVYQIELGEHQLHLDYFSAVREMH